MHSRNSGTRQHSNPQHPDQAAFQPTTSRPGSIPTHNIPTRQHYNPHPNQAAFQPTTSRPGSIPTTTSRPGSIPTHIPTRQHSNPQHPDVAAFQPTTARRKANTISMGECNTILSAYTKYRHLG